MSDELFQTMFESVDPGRDLSDETLNELLPHDALMAKITAGITAEAPASARAKTTPRWRRIPTFVGASVAAGSVAVAGALMLFGSSPALVQGTGVGTKTTTSIGSGVTQTGTRMDVPKCKLSQLTEWMEGQSGRYVATQNYTAKVIFTNTGKTCSLARTYVGALAVTGKEHEAIGHGSVTPSVAYNRSIILQRGHTAAATITIGSTSTSSFHKMLKNHDGTCAPKYADAIKVFGLYSGWPVKYFTLPVPVSVCTTYWSNVAAGTIAITKRVIVHG
jgi:hypothetical protein